MGITPPRHGLELNTLSVIRRLSWLPVEADVGEVRGGWIAVAGDDAFDALWCAGEQGAPTGIAPRYIAKDAWTALREGQIAQDGALLWQGRRWRLVDVAQGSRLVARLIADGTTA